MTPKPRFSARDGDRCNPPNARANKEVRGEEYTVALTASECRVVMLACDLIPRGESDKDAGMSAFGKIRDAVAVTNYMRRPEGADPSRPMSKWLLTVDFAAESVTIEVEAESLEEAWTNRYGLAAAAEPVSWEVHPRHIEGPA